MPRPIVNGTYLLNDYVRGIAFPYISYNYMGQQASPEHMRIEAQRLDHKEIVHHHQDILYHDNNYILLYYNVTLL